jgi:phosphate-selective porin OprO/OprP
LTRFTLSLTAGVLASSTFANAQPSQPDEPVAPEAPVAPPPEEPPPPVEPVPPPATTDPWIDKQPPATAEPAKPKVEVSAKAGSGVTFKAGDGFSLNLRGRGQVRYQIHAAPPVDGEREFDETAIANTVRVWLGGHVLNPRLTYMLQVALGDRDFRDGAVSPIFDAFVDYKTTANISIRAGQFFVPFDRLRTVREFALQLGERPRPVGELTLDRDVGIVVYAEKFLNTPLTWRLGVWGGNGVNRNKVAKVGQMFTARVELRPLGPIDDDSEGDLERRREPKLAIGAGWASNFNTDRSRSTSGAFLDQDFNYHHQALDAVFKWRGFALQLELLRRTASRHQFDVIAAGEPVTEFTREGYGWVAQASYVFDPPVEIVGRVSRLYAADVTDPKYITEVEKLGQEYAAGVNYYLNGHQFKIQSGWIGRTGTVGTKKFDHLFQVQIDFTF